MNTPGLLFEQADFFWLFSIICLAAIVLTATGIKLYHLDGGSKPTKQIIREAVIGYFMPLTVTVRLIRKLFNRKSP